MEKRKLTKGFIATKGQDSFELRTEVYPLGIYLHTFENGKVLDQTSRSTLPKAEKYIEEQKHKLAKRKYVIADQPDYHYVYRDAKTLKFKTSL